MSDMSDTPELTPAPIPDVPVAPVPAAPMPSAPADQGGVPLWLPLLALLIAFAFAALVATRVLASLSGLVSPPEPVLPAAAVLKSTESKDTLTTWLYETKTPACTVAELYEKQFGKCNYAPTSGCGGGGTTPDMALHIANCAGEQKIGQYRVFWEANISTDGAGLTVFRLDRTLG